jgi:hypothetical protein
MISSPFSAVLPVQSQEKNKLCLRWDYLKTEKQRPPATSFWEVVTEIMILMVGFYFPISFLIKSCEISYVDWA